MMNPQNGIAASPASSRHTPVIGLMVGASVWGIVWYPYRVLEAQGMSGIEASILTYIAALFWGGLLWRKQLRGVRSVPLLIAVGLAAGACNLGYILSTLFGEVTRVLLLFYLSPLWTVLFARLLLGERVTRVGIGVMALSLTGAVVMLWHPEKGVPVPSSLAEWLGLGAGVCFSFSNVLIKKTSDISIEHKTMAIFLGVITLSLIAMPLLPGKPWALAAYAWPMILLVGLTLVFTNAIVQYGITHLSASRAIVVMLFELVIAALAAWLLAGETLGLREWAGGLLIVGASLMSTRLENPTH